MTGRPAPVMRWLLVVVLGAGLVGMHSLVGPAPVAGHGSSGLDSAGLDRAGHAAVEHPAVEHPAVEHPAVDHLVADPGAVHPGAVHPAVDHLVTAVGYPAAPGGRHEHDGGSSMPGHGCLAVLGALVLLIAALLLLFGMPARPYRRRRLGAGVPPMRPRSPPARPPGQYELCVLRC